MQLCINHGNSNMHHFLYKKVIRFISFIQIGLGLLRGPQVAFERCDLDNGVDTAIRYPMAAGLNVNDVLACLSRLTGNQVGPTVDSSARVVGLDDRISS